MTPYAVITPAHNEEAHIERVILSMIAQDHKPIRWIIVDDSSTDSTKAIAERYSAQWNFIEVMTLKREGTRGFHAKASAFNAGAASLRGVNYDFIGNVDADLSFHSDYFSNLLDAFNRDPALGLTGGSIYTSIGSRFVTHDKTVDSVAGAVQLFRRRCFEDIGGGYLPLPFGGIDAAAEIIAKHRGWRVEKRLDQKVYEHRQTGTASTTPIAACFRLGRRFHSLGYGKLFYLVRCIYRLGDEPVILGSCAAIAGYVEALIVGRPVLLPPEVVRRLRRHQLEKLHQLIFRSSPQDD